MELHPHCAKKDGVRRSIFWDGNMIIPDQSFFLRRLTIGLSAIALDSELLCCVTLPSNRINSYQVDSLPLWTNTSNFPFETLVRWLVKATKYRKP